jgi:hypothetical protein
MARGTGNGAGRPRKDRRSEAELIAALQGMVAAGTVVLAPWADLVEAQRADDASQRRAWDKAAAEYRKDKLRSDRHHNGRKFWSAGEMASSDTLASMEDSELGED